MGYRSTILFRRGLFSVHAHKFFDLSRYANRRGPQRVSMFLGCSEGIVIRAVCPEFSTRKNMDHLRRLGRSWQTREQRHIVFQRCCPSSSCRPSWLPPCTVRNLMRRSVTYRRQVNRRTRKSRCSMTAIRRHCWSPTANQPKCSAAYSGVETKGSQEMACSQGCSQSFHSRAIAD